MGSTLQPVTGLLSIHLLKLSLFFQELLLNPVVATIAFSFDFLPTSFRGNSTTQMQHHARMKQLYIFQTLVPRNETIPIVLKVSCSKSK